MFSKTAQLVKRHIRIYVYTFIGLNVMTSKPEWNFYHFCLYKKNFKIYVLTYSQKPYNLKFAIIS